MNDTLLVALIQSPARSPCLAVEGRATVLWSRFVLNRVSARSRVVEAT